MPGNEVGDRIHNFFAQENLSQGQHHPEVADGTWTGLGNNPWVGSQRQAGTSFISNLKNQSGQQSVDSERGYGGQSSTVLHGMNFAHQFARSQSQIQQPTANGYMHGNQVFQTSESNANLLGVDTDNDRRNLTSRSFSILDAQVGSGPESYKKNSLRMDFNDAPTNYDFLGGQQHMSNQHPGMLQSLPRQQSGISDMQLLQQQVMLKQMQEMQRQQQHQKQQFQQQESRQLNSSNQVSSFAKQAAGGHPSAMVNGVPIHDASSYSWHPELMPANSNWSQHVASPAMQGSSSGLLFSPEQAQAPRFMGMIPHQLDQSLHGVPISGTRISPNQYSPVQIDKPTIQQMSGSSNSFGGNHYARFPDNAGMHDGTLVARQGYQGKNMVGSADTQDLNVGLNLENLEEVDAQQSNGPTLDLHRRQDLRGSSDTPQEKTVMQVAPSHNVATLDPTEEKILFGSDDNLWDAFGKSANVSSGGSIVDGGDVFGSFPSMQSGSWSALMQSAVAETSSADVGLQEEWSGPTFQNTEPPSGNQSSTNVNDSVKQQSTWADNRLLSGSMSNARPYGISDGFNNMAGLKQSGVSPSNEPIERLHSGVSQRYVQPFSGEGTKWLDRKLLQKPVSEGVHNYEKSVHSSDADSNTKSISGSWMNQQSISSCNTGGQPSSTPNGWKFVDSVSPGARTVLKNPGNETSFQASQSTESKNQMFEAMGYGAGLWKTDSVSNSLRLEQIKSSTGSPQVNREDSSSNNAVFPESNTARTHPESFQQTPNGNNIDIWKHVDHLVNNPKGRDFPGKHQTHMDMNHQTVELSGNRNGNGVVETQDYSDTKESKTNSFHNVGLYNSTTGVRENAWLDASDSLTLSGANVKPSNIVRKPSGIRKFQYHPMGDLDVDVEHSYTHQQPTLTQVSPGLKGQDHGGISQPKFPPQMARNSMEFDKGRFPGFQGDEKGLDETASKNIVSGSAPSTSTSFDRAAHNYATGRTTQSSQNMLELLHKVDQSGEHGSATNFSSSDRNQLSEMHEINNCNGSIHLHQNQSSTSQGFGLQLGPPAQLLPAQDRALSSPSPSQANNSLSSIHVTSEAGEKGHTWLASTSSVQSLPLSHEISQGELRSKTSSTFGQTGKNTQAGNSSMAFSPGFPYPRSDLQNQHMYDAGGQATTSQSVNVFFDRLSSQSKQASESYDRTQSSQSMASVPDMSGSALLSSKATSGERCYLSNNIQNNGKDSPPQFPVLESVPATQGPTVSGASQENSAKVKPDTWNSVSIQQSRAQYNVFKSNNDSETSSRPHKQEAHNVQMIGNAPSEIGASSVSSHGSAGKEHPAKGDSSQHVSPENDPGKKIMNVSQGAESAATCVPGTSISNHSSTQREIEAFGRSLRPNSFSHQNYSMHQIQGMRNAEVDPSNRSSKRFKGPDNSGDVQELGQQLYDHNSMAIDASPAHATKPTDVKDTKTSSQDVVTFGKNDSQNFSNSSVVAVRAEHSKISPQMAPSWFDQYGTFKNGQISPLPDAQKVASVKTMDLPFNVGRPSSSFCASTLVEQGNAVDADACLHGLLPKSLTPSSLASDNLSSPQVTNSNVADASLTVIRPKKRKTATSELIPWHKQVVHGLRMLQNISSAESDWAHAANRLTEKVEDEVEMSDDGPPVYRSKRRLVITTQLMQLLFSPPAASVLSADAMSHYESVVHFLARSTVGDACCTLSCAGSDTRMPSSSGNILPEKLKKSERISDQYFSKVVEDLIGRARKLENDILRLDKRASVLDLRVECQELEKYSVINRFAKFHGRAQADAAEISSPDAPSNAQKSCLQRYVTAIPMPRNLPDRVQCFSL
ncbi:uncharacterized protein [Euphorbia lathyris]|uniref:uncharacterized protein n=1 Tax=Euphorbia lathyris TaxID=212925 RepID=UPI003314309B